MQINCNCRKVNKKNSQKPKITLPACNENFGKTTRRQTLLSNHCVVLVVGVVGVSQQTIVTKLKLKKLMTESPMVSSAVKKKQTTKNGGIFLKKVLPSNRAFRVNPMLTMHGCI
jgi:hypothetical protein